MKVTIRHPALVRAKTKGGRVARPSVILPEAEFTIHDLDSRQAPIAFTVSKSTYGRPPITREVRAFNDGLYLTVMRESSYSQSEGPETLDELVAAVSSGALDRKGFLLPIIEKVRSGMRHGGDETVLPSGIYNGLNYNDLPYGHDLVNAAVKLADQIVIDDEVRTEIAAWHAATQRHIDKFISVDGHVYKRCGEPIYILQQSVYDVSSLDVHYLESGRGNGPNTLLTFAATSRDEALATLALAKTRDPEIEGQPSDPQVVIDVVDGAYVNWRAEERDFDRFARDFERTYNAAIDDLRKRGNIRIPREVYDAWLDLRDILYTYDKMSGPIPEELEGVLATAIDTWRGYHEQIGDEICKLRAPSLGIVDTMYQRFADRPIDMGPVVGYGGPALKP
ncbi:hypothetical protein OIU34_19825 [Pararhizobium sp. BT-229]|uniref:hypothetical protein n=1 Tax=Pararhizobium sp. BT-229 TaxID=2986923 RepID=UPI0021F7D43E|nr:hypothetical protein [Pararhizobium sp. BT-229]MCV9964135.1 hypothetical protein [Pararhizobium sp. BT-229]